MNTRIDELAIQAGLISADWNSFDRTGLTVTEKKFAELIITQCLHQCKQVAYDAMEIPLDRSSDTIDFDRGSKSGRKWGAIDCVAAITEHFKDVANV